MSHSDNGDVHSGTILKLGGKKSFGHRWQWRQCTIREDCELHYFDPKTSEQKGSIHLEKAYVKAIDGDDCIIEKLRKFKVPSPPSNLSKEIKEFSYFQLKPNNSCKTYYFAVENSDRENWLKFISFCFNGPKTLKQKIYQSLELPTLLLHTDSPLTSPRVEFSNEVRLREIDCDFSDTLSGESSAPSSFQFSISFSDSCSTKLSSYLESPRSANDEITNKGSHSGSMSSTSSTISYRSYLSYGTNNSDLQMNDILNDQNGSATDTIKIPDDSPRSAWRASKKCSQSSLQCLISPHRRKSSSDLNESKKIIEKNPSSPRSGDHTQQLNRSMDTLTLKDRELVTEG